jgi:hypothetical protein
MGWSSLGELGTIRRYSYWSDRRIRAIAADNNLDLGRRWRLSVRTPTFGLAPQAELAEDRRTVQRHEIAQRVERAIGQTAVDDFVTPPKAAFAKGCGEVTFAAYRRLNGKKKDPKAVIIHTRFDSADGTCVEICLFGSIEHCADYLAGGEPRTAGWWSSSSAEAVEEFIANRGTRPSPIYRDDESMAVEILKTINYEGMTDLFVFKRIASADWFAEVYQDVVLSKDRWKQRTGRDLTDPVGRIVVGAPLWVRSNGS